MAQIHATADAVVATARALLALADDPSEVEFTHGPDGAMFIVSDALADKLVAATDDEPEAESEENASPPKVSPQTPVELEKPNPTPPSPPPAPSPTTRVNPRAKVTKES